MEKRIYDRWAGNPNGVEEDVSRCVEDVVDLTGWHIFQCSRKRGHGPDGLYCKQHAKKVERILAERDAQKGKG